MLCPVRRAGTDLEAMAAAPSDTSVGRSRAVIIRPPHAWILEKISSLSHPPTPLSPARYWPDAHLVQTVPEVRRIGAADLRMAIANGYRDLGEFRTDVVFICLIYPVLGLLMAWMGSGYRMLPLLFPLVSGFALVGPFAAIGLMEMSRRRELGLSTRWIDNFAVLHSPALGRVLLLGCAQIGLLFLWMIAAQAIYATTLGPDAPASASQFVRDVLTTPAGQTMIAVGVGVGFVFALAVLTLTAFAFPMMLDRNVRIEIAIRTSIRVAQKNKRTVALWGLIVAGLLVAGSLPALLGLIVVMPLLGHATWHLYRAAVAD